MGFSRLRFAKIENIDVNKDFLNRIAEGIRSIGIINVKPNRFGFSFVKKDEDHTYAKFVKERVRKDSVLNPENEESKEERIVAHFKYVFIFLGGYIAYESLRVQSGIIFDTISNAWKKMKKKEEGEIKIVPIKGFDYKLLKEFYQESKKVKYLVIKKIGEMEPNPHIPKDIIKNITSDIGKEARKMELTAKRKSEKEEKKEGNLKKIELVNEGLIALSEPDRVKGVDAEGFPFQIEKTGVISIYTSDDDEKKRNKLIKLIRKVKKYIKVND